MCWVCVMVTGGGGTGNGGVRWVSRTQDGQHEVSMEKAAAGLGIQLPIMFAVLLCFNKFCILCATGFQGVVSFHTSFIYT